VITLANNDYKTIFGTFQQQREQIIARRAEAQAEKQKALEEKQKAHRYIKEYRTPEPKPKTRQFLPGYRGAWAVERQERIAREKREAEKRAEARRIETEILPEIGEYERGIAEYETGLGVHETELAKQEAKIKEYQKKGYEVRETPEGKLEFYKMIPVAPAAPKLSGVTVGGSYGGEIPIEHAQAQIYFVSGGVYQSTVVPWGQLESKKQQLKSGGATIENVLAISSQQAEVTKTQEFQEKVWLETLPSEVAFDVPKLKKYFGAVKGEGYVIDPSYGTYKEVQALAGKFEIEKLKKEYLETRVVPELFQPKYETTVDQPTQAELKGIGVSPDFLRTATYEQYLGIRTQDYTEQKISKAIEDALSTGAVAPDIAFIRKYGRFGEDELSYAEFKKKHPELVLESLFASITPRTDIGKHLGVGKPYEQLMATQEWKDFLKTYRGRTYLETTAKALHELEVRKPITWDIPFIGKITQPQWMADLNISTVSVLDYGKAEQKLAKQISQGTMGADWYKELPFRARIELAAAESGLQMLAFPITLTQTAIKYATGEGDWADPFKRIETGETLGILPDVGYELGVRKIAPVRGHIERHISEGLELFGAPKQDFFADVKKYPIESMFATAGEIGGIVTASYGLGLAKVGIVKGAGKFKMIAQEYTGTQIPFSYATYMKYKPINIFRTIKYKIGEKAGRYQYVPPEYVMQTKALPGGLSYAPGKTAMDRISNLLRAFEKTKTEQGLYTGVHTTATSTWFKPIAWMRKGRESPGVSFAPLGEGAPRFLRITGDALYYRPSAMSLIPKIKMPTAPLLYFEKLISIPKGMLGRSSAFIKSKAPGVFVAPKMYWGGGEYEAIARGFAGRLGMRFFTKIEGVVVPMPEFGLGLGKMGLLDKIGTTMGKTIFDYSPYYKTSISILSPSVMGSFVKSRLPSYTSRMPSYKAPSGSYGLSRAISSMISSIASYKPSYKPSYKAPYKSSYKPSTFSSYISSLTSYKPSYTPSMPSYTSPSIPSYGLSYKPRYTFPYALIYGYSGKPRKRKPKREIPLWDEKYLFRMFDITDPFKATRKSGKRARRAVKRVHKRARKTVKRTSGSRVKRSKKRKRRTR